MRIKSLIVVVLLTSAMVFARPAIPRCEGPGEGGGGGACDWEVIQNEGCGWFEWLFCTGECLVVGW